MIRLLICALALLACAAHATVIGVVEAHGTRIEFHDEPGQCVGGAMRAEFVANDGLRIAGCWTLRTPELVGVAFLDGDAVSVPVAAIRRPVRL